MSWKQHDALLRQTEFGAVGERLINGLANGAREIAALSQAANLECGRIAEAIAHYMEEAEGLLGEFGFRRDSSWGESILQTRVVLSAAIGREFLSRAAEHMLKCVLPVERGGGRGMSAVPNLREAPSEAAVAEAVATARLLMLLVQRGARHGFGQPARDTIDGLSTELAKRTTDLLDALRRNSDQPVAEAQITAAVQVLDLLFDDGRGTTVARRMRLARQATA